MRRKGGTEGMKEMLRIHDSDNVAVALRDLKAGEEVQVEELVIELLNDVPRGHKVAIQEIDNQENVIKYGFPIGHTIAPVRVGEWVHTHNTKTNLKGEEQYEYHPIPAANNGYAVRDLTFQGYLRPDGRAGIRNELWIVPTVGCVNGVAERIMARFIKEVGDMTPFDNSLVLKHPYGCSQLGDDHAHTVVMLQNAVRHPNAGGVLVLGLGCENNELSEFRKTLGEGTYDQSRVKFLVAQEVGDEIEEGVKLLKEIYQAAQSDQRQALPLSKLTIGLKCGGSDGFSGITANPLLGRLSDFLAAQGGTTVLTEVPEMFGAETILMERAANREVFEQIVDLINDFKHYFEAHEQPIYENPSPGNKAGGITTLEDKSLGCTQKAGTSPVVDVLKYGERLRRPGLNLLSAPGNDLVAASALAASGCQMVLFTTGRGTPFGTFVPTVKVSTNTAIHQLKPHWIDFNAGTLAEEGTPEEVLKQFIAFVIGIASGSLVNNEKNDFREIAIFKEGVTL